MTAISNRIHSGPATQEFTLNELSHSEEEVLPSSDPSTWRQLTPADSASVVLNGPPQNPPTSQRDSSERPFSLIFKTLPNGEKVPRDWLVWSQTAKRFLWYPYCLFKGCCETCIALRILSPYSSRLSKWNVLSANLLLRKTASDLSWAKTVYQLYTCCHQSMILQEN